MSKKLYLLRGLPGSGKSTLAKSLTSGSGQSHYEADMYFMEDGVYKFNASRLNMAHTWCLDMVKSDMHDGIPLIVVSNTFTKEWEMDAYYKLAKEHSYKVTSLIVENRHGGVNVHGVPDEALTRMRDRFEIKL